LDFITDKIGKKVPIIYLTPSWDLLQQKWVEKYYQELSDEVIIICGHYEWIDQRIRDLYVTHEISIGEYVLSSWELSAMVFIDSFVRNIPEVLWNPESLEEESFSKKLHRKKEYPVYTRPSEFRWLKVPDVLTSWNHKEIEKWKFNNLK
jgi:tRNA (guanine37-N1)-methyltransferase